MRGLGHWSGQAASAPRLVFHPTCVQSAPLRFIFFKFYGIHCCYEYQI